VPIRPRHQSAVVHPPRHRHNPQLQRAFSPLSIVWRGAGGEGCSCPSDPVTNLTLSIPLDSRTYVRYNRLSLVALPQRHLRRLPRRFIIYRGFSCSFQRLCTISRDSIPCRVLAMGGLVCSSTHPDQMPFSPANGNFGVLLPNRPSAAPQNFQKH
jgi:hypothetical protein